VLDDVRMRAVCQRVKRADVSVAGETVGEIDAGLVGLLRVARTDSREVAERLAVKVGRLRIFRTPTESSTGAFSTSAAPHSSSASSR